MEINNECAAVCGLFCGNCPQYIQGECGGCLSQNCCCDCFNGFKDCAKMQNVTRCYECKIFPCEKLESFSKKHIVNGIGHHEHVIENLGDMKLNGIDTWIEKQTKKHTCENCGRLIEWFYVECHNCKKSK